MTRQQRQRRHARRLAHQNRQDDRHPDMPTCATRRRATSRALTKSLRAGDRRVEDAHGDALQYRPPTPLAPRRPLLTERERRDRGIGPAVRMFHQPQRTR